MRVVTQVGDASRPTKTVEVDETKIRSKELRDYTHMDGGKREVVLLVEGYPEPIQVDDPVLVAKLWTPDKPGKLGKKDTKA